MARNPLLALLGVDDLGDETPRSPLLPPDAIETAPPQAHPLLPPPTATQASRDPFPEPNYERRNALLARIEREQNSIAWPVPGYAKARQSSIENNRALLHEEDQFSESDYQNRLRAFTAQKPKPPHMMANPVYAGGHAYAVGTTEEGAAVRNDLGEGESSSMFGATKRARSKDEDRVVKERIANMQNATALEKIQTMEGLGYSRIEAMEAIAAAHDQTARDVGAGHDTAKVDVAGMPARTQPASSSNKAQVAGLDKDIAWLRRQVAVGRETDENGSNISERLRLLQKKRAALVAGSASTPGAAQAAPAAPKDPLGIR